MKTFDSPNLDAARQGVLARMDRHARYFRLALLGGALAEAALLGVGLWKLDLHDRFQAAVFLLFVLSYCIIAMGLLALGAHVSRVGERILAALDARERV